MDPGSCALSTSIISENLDLGNANNPADMLKLMFKACKSEIAYAINKTFPFLEILRDHDLISDEFYEELQSDIRKEVPVPYVLYSALKAIEDRFHQQHLDILFHEIHLKEYPELQKIHESFKAAMQQIAYMQDGNRANHALEGPAGPLFLEQATSENLQESLTAVSQSTATPDDTTVDVNGVSGHPSDTDEVHAKRKDIPSREIHGLKSEQTSHHCGQEPEQASLHCGQEPEQAELCKEAFQVNNGDARKKIPGPLFSAKQRAELSKYALESNSCFTSLMNVMKERPPSNPSTECNQRLDIIEISSDELADSDREEPPKASTSTLKRQMDDTDSRKLLEFRKHQEKRVKRLESFSGSSKDEAPQMDDCMDEDPENIGNVSDGKTSNEGREVNSDDSTELIIREKPQATCSSALRRGSDITDRGSNSISRKHSWKRKLSIKYKSRSTQVKKGDIQRTEVRRSRKRKTRFHRDRNMNFDAPVLPVTCGEAKGTLYKEKLKLGSSSKCILRENGDAWISLREFEIEGGMEKCKNWRLSVRSGGWPLKELIKRNHLPNPPITKVRKTRRILRRNVSNDGNTSYDPCPENSNLCEVCGRSGTLYCCDSCPRSFHMNCHIEPIDVKRDPWFCIFCSVKTIQEDPSQNQSYQESEVLLRSMDHINDLKCKFLLLKMYSYSKSSFFVYKPHHSKGYGPEHPRSMCLNWIKNKLHRKKYLQVGEFVKDMRLIVENHKSVYGVKSIVILGYQLEKRFEKNFKDIFKIQ